MKIKGKTSGGYEFIVPDGEIDMAVSPKLRDLLLAAFKKTSKGVVVDLSGVSYMDSSGIATLVEGLQLSQKKRIRFVLVGVQEKVMGTLKLAKLQDLFDIYKTESDALGDIKA